MEKIISLFQRNYEGNRLVRDEIVPSAEWVVNGEGQATIKMDGTSCLIRAGQLYKRYDAKPGRTPPPDFEQSGEADPVTGRVQGWVPVGDRPEDKWHREAWDNFALRSREGTYELVGPKIQGNPYGYSFHRLIAHDSLGGIYPPRDFIGIKFWLTENNVEGIVWHHPDGRMVKIKAKDFGIKWPRRDVVNSGSEEVSDAKLPVATEVAPTGGGPESRGWADQAVSSLEGGTVPD